MLAPNGTTRRWTGSAVFARSFSLMRRSIVSMSSSFATGLGRSYSITSSARASSVASTSRPSVLAVFRLITSSYLVGAWTSRSAGFSPLRTHAAGNLDNRHVEIVCAASAHVNVSVFYHQGPAQDLPQANSGAGEQQKMRPKSLILLVGATGFEPVTWSTQNSRATRLRYAPAPCRASIHGSVCASKPRWAAATSLPAAAEDRVPHPVARRDAELLGGAADDFEHRAHRPAGGHERFRERHRVLGDAQDAPVAADEDHVERDIGVLHPEAGRLFLMEVEQHALPFRQLAAEHESFRLLLRR